MFDPAASMQPQANSATVNAQRLDALRQQREAQIQQQQQQQQQRGGILPSALGTYGAYKGISSLFTPAAATPDLAATSAAPYGSGMVEGLANAPATSAPFASHGAEEASKALNPTEGVGTVGNVLAALAVLHGGYGSYKNFGKGNWKGGAMSGAETGAGLGTIIPGAGTLAGAGIGAVVGGLAGLVKNGKQEDQIARDAVRSSLQQAGFVDKGFNLALANGGSFNIGIDGHARPDTSGGRRAYEVNTDNPLSTQAVGWVNPLAEIITGGNDKLRSDFAGYLANAAMSNATTMDGVRANVMGFMQKLGLDANGILSKLQDLKKAGGISDEELQAYTYAINSLLKGDPKLYVKGPLQPGPVAPSMPQAPTPAPTPVPAPTPAAAPTPAPAVNNGSTMPLQPPPQQTRPVNPQTNDAAFNRPTQSPVRSILDQRVRNYGG